MVLRFRLLIGASALCYAVLLFNLYQLQIVKGSYYVAKAESQYLASNVLNAKRGIIYFADRNGVQSPAAFNKDVPTVYAVPSRVDDAKEAAQRLSQVIGTPADDLEKALSKKKDPYEVLVRRADARTVRQIEELNVKGVYVDVGPSRYYPFGSRAAHLLGFVGPAKDSPKETGHYGVEEFYDAALTAKIGSASSSRRGEQEYGTDLQLSVDINIQIEAERILHALVLKHNAEGGTAIVMEPQTGKVLALANTPSFDPNTYSTYAVSRFFNSAVQGRYEPGSVFKVITMAAGIDAGKIAPGTTYTDTGSVRLNGRTIENYDTKSHGPYGTITMTEVIEHSVNTGAVFAQRRTGREIFTDYVQRFGFGRKTGIDLLGEVEGDLRQLTPKARDIAFATASFGQGVAVTPIELITAISAIANGGKLMRPYVNAALEPRIVRQAVSPETARKVTVMMVSAVDKAGVTSIKGYTVAGKTGTAFIPDFKKGGYTEDVINTYVGFAPTVNPRFVALIKLVKPESAPLAGTSVVPAFKELAQFIIHYYRVEPDRLPVPVVQR